MHTCIQISLQDLELLQNETSGLRTMPKSMIEAQSTSGNHAQEGKPGVISLVVFFHETTGQRHFFAVL